MALHFQRVWPEFDAAGFESSASSNLEALELKARSNQITETMLAYLPADFAQAGEIILATLSPALEDDNFSESVDQHGIAGWAIMPMAHYIGLHGHDHIELSMTLLKELTKRFTSEFGIRFFLLQSPEKTLLTLKEWTKDRNHHVRRLVSEGSRPRLPWAMQLPQFIKDPTAVIALLELLKDDEHEYVRRSVANNLNDISKDHPDKVADIAKEWMIDASLERKRLIRHACRTLIKSGHRQTMRTFGYQPPKLSQVQLKIITPDVEFDTALQFSLKLNSSSQQSQSLMIDYIIHHQKANGKTSPKVFKWSTKNIAANGELSLSKKHPIKKITTRAYYPGLHRIEIMVNGESVAIADFQLLMP